MVNRNSKLDIFEDFIVDKTLPKFDKEKKNETYSSDVGGFVSINNSFITRTQQLDDEIDYAWLHIYERRKHEFNRNPTFSNKLRFTWCKFLIWLTKIMLVKEQNRDKSLKKIYENTENFFKRVKESFKEIKSENVGEIEEFYKNHILQAESLRQITLVETLKDKLDLIKQEMVLLNGNIKIYVTEEDIVKFSGVYKIKKLHLTWIKNFNRVIPNDIFELKLKADKLNIFDNYVILHTDASGDVVGETKAERKARIEREKDPILFGVMKNSRKLYFIGDWEDEYCDLTLEKMMDKLGSENKELSTDSIKQEIVKTKID